MTELDSGPLQHWLTATAPPAPRQPVARAGSPDPPPAAEQGPADMDAGDGRDAARGAGAAGSGRVVAMRAELEQLRATAVLQRDPAWLDVLSAREERRERGAARRLRGMRRHQHLAAATATVRLAGRERRAEHRLAALEMTDRVWQRRALARRTRLLDPTSRLASIQRTHTATSTALIALAIAGIIWTSVGVHDALVGPDGTWLAYIVEPLFSLPLVVIMAVQAVAAGWGRTFPTREHRTKVYALEAGLLGATVLLNISPVVPGLGRWVDTTTLLAHLVPPALILVAVTLTPLVGAFLAGILADAHHDATDTGGRRLEPDTANLLALVGKVRAAIATGELAVTPGTGRPSTEAIRRFFACEKRRAQAVTDALALLDVPLPGPAAVSADPARQS